MLQPLIGATGKDAATNVGKDAIAATILTEGMITIQGREIMDTTMTAEDINDKNLLQGRFFFMFIAN